MGEKEVGIPGVTIAVYLPKGGVGKTTLVGLLGVYLAGLGFRVVIIDLDIQGSQSALFDLVDETGRGGEVLHRVLKRELDATAALTPVPDDLILPLKNADKGDLFVIQGGPRTSEAIDDIANAPVRYKLASTLDIVCGPVRALSSAGVDIVLLDMGPSDQVSALAGLVATDYLIMPTTMDYLTVERIAPALEEVEVARQEALVQVVGIVPMMTSYYFGGLRKSVTVQMGEKYLAENYNDLVLRDERGMIDLPYHEDIRKMLWAGLSSFSSIGASAKSDVMRVLNALAAKMGIDHV